MAAGSRRRRCAERDDRLDGSGALLLGMSIGRAADNNETSMTVQVSSAEHETDEGYFSLGKDATVMAKPGSALHQFLARQNGRQVRVTLTLVDGRQLSRLER